MKINVRDIQLAYRKAKFDMIDSRVPSRRKLLEFERGLDDNLNLILRELEGVFQGWAGPLRDRCRGDYWLSPKKIRFAESTEESRAVIIADRSHLSEDREITRYDLRLWADVPVAFHVVTTLWLMKVGPKLDSMLSECCHGNRLRRERDGNARFAAIDELALGSFRPYKENYRVWMKEAIDALRQPYVDKSVSWMFCGDFESYFHNVSPRILLKSEFLDWQTEDEKTFTSFIVGLMEDWAKTTPIGKGLPVGCAISSLAANLALKDFDEQMQRLSVEMRGAYGRYVDDIIFVGRAEPGQISTLRSFYDLLNLNTGLSVDEDGVLGCDKEILSDSSAQGFRFSADKCKLVICEAGWTDERLDMLSEELNMQTSMARRMPERLEQKSMVVSRLLRSRDRSGRLPGDVRQIDDIFANRAEFGRMVADVLSFSRALAPLAWAEERKAFLSVVLRHFLDHDLYFEFFDYYPRIVAALGLPSKHAINDELVEDDESEEESMRPTREYGLVRSLLSRISRLLPSTGDPIRVADRDVAEGQMKGECIRNLRRFVAEGLLEGMIATTQTEADGDEIWDALPELFREAAGQPEGFANCQEFSDHDLTWQAQWWAPDRDLGMLCKMTEFGVVYPSQTVPTMDLFDHVELWSDEKALEKVHGWNLAINGEDLAILAHVKASEEGALRCISVSNCKLNVNSIRVAIVHWLVELEEWGRMAVADANGPDGVRYDRLRRVIDTVLAIEPRPQFVVFPELAMPKEWFREIAQILAQFSISLISGVEYIHTPNGSVMNEAWCSLVCAPSPSTSDQFCVPVRFRKAQPSEEEGVELSKRNIPFESDLFTRNGGVTVVQHGNGTGALFFSALICSDLTNIDFRSRLRGEIDLLLALCWNQDVHSFESLVASAALDLHAYVACVNNRAYGDSRIRIPASETWFRDMLRIKGGTEDIVMVADLDVARLRRSPAPPKDKDDNNDPGVHFKPLPTGFKMADVRSP